LHALLWAYITTPYSTTESPFRLTYGIEAVIPIELTELTWRTTANTDFPANTANLREELEFVDKVKNDAALRETALKQKIAARHGKKVRQREFEVGDLVLRRNQKDSEDRNNSIQTRRPPWKHHSKNLECRENQKVLHLEDIQTPNYSKVHTKFNTNELLAHPTGKNKWKRKVAPLRIQKKKYK
jgi:hypothetical protein